MAAKRWGFCCAAYEACSEPGARGHHGAAPFPMQYKRHHPVISKRRTSEALAQLTRRAPSTTEFLEVLGELHSESDRSAAIIGAAFVEDALQRALLSRMRSPLKSEDRKRLFGANAPLSSFAGKIIIAYATYLIGPQTRDDFDCVREIRNAFAHTVGSLSFETPQVAVHCAHLRLPSVFPASPQGPHELPWPPPPSEPRRLYMATITLLWTRLREDAATDRIMPEEAFSLI
jgi:hypothetical protein